ncbi:Protein of unknown function (DUF2456) [Geosmithia morbida]|uniref:Uncharacterized protein n=1 Tax=Geosmithia morbida TaxID=1094350 RepID=A0A9P5D4F0_9HYPO|nr:Protein of unknown function (DUF2456) [Geosmithia morbida]KAF4121429.1 Protein of unknown function (DUF2456) [Geosmithia morbida]
MLEKGHPSSPTVIELYPDLEASNGPPLADNATATPQIATDGPNFTDANTAAQDDEDGRDDGQGPLLPSKSWTAHQLFYVFGIDGIGAMILSGGVNFAIAYVMYTTQDTVKNPIRLFSFPNTLAGDAAVTVIIQCLLTWFVEWGLVAYDLSNRSVQPIGFLSEPRNRWVRWYFFLDGPSPLPTSASTPTTAGDDGEEPASTPGLPPFLSLVVNQAIRGFALCIPAFLLLWPISVAAMIPFGKPQPHHDYLYTDRWAPQVLKLALGGMLGLLTTPLMAMFWLVRAGWDAAE